MTLTPLLEAPPAIVVHAMAAMTAFVLGIVQLAAPKGTIPHRTVGWIWVGLMLGVSASSFLIHQIQWWGGWSPIHLLSIFTLASLPVAVWAARRHRVLAHRLAMTSIFLGAHWSSRAPSRCCRAASCTRSYSAPGLMRPGPAAPRAECTQVPESASEKTSLISRFRVAGAV